MSEKNEKHTSELSMEELENVAGGAADNFLWFPEPAVGAERALGKATAVAPTGPTTPPTPSTTPGH